MGASRIELCCRRKLGFGTEGRSPIEWTTLARYGITVVGPEPEVHTDRDELVAWVRGNADTYWRNWLTAYPRALFTDWGVAWGVLGISRLHYTVTTGDITSKSGAGKYALATFPDHWHAIVTEALRHRRAQLTMPEGEPDAERRDAARAFIESTIEQITAQP